MKNILKMCFVISVILCLMTNVYCSELKLNEQGFYMMEYNPYIIKGLTKKDLDENDLLVKEKILSYITLFPNKSKASLKEHFESEDEEIVDKVIRFLSIDFNENALRYAKKIQGYGLDMEYIKKDLKNEGFTSMEINYAIEKITVENNFNNGNTSNDITVTDPIVLTDKVKEIIEEIQTINYFIPLSRKETKNALRLYYKPNDLERALDECKVDWQKMLTIIMIFIKKK